MSLEVIDDKRSDLKPAGLNSITQPPAGLFMFTLKIRLLSCLLLKRLKDGKKSVNRTMPASAKTTSVTLLVSTAEILRKIYVGKGKSYETHHEAVNDIIVKHCKLKEVIYEQYHHLSFIFFSDFCSNDVL
jgi:hypothetical protein